MMPVDPAERAAMAAEYVIGTLHASELTEFEHALARDFELQREVYYWQDKLLPMTRILKPVEPAAAVWARIERSITQQQQSAPRRTSEPNWWQGLTFWRSGAFAASLLAVVLAVQLLGPGRTPTAESARSTSNPAWSRPSGSSHREGRLRGLPVPAFRRR